MRFYSPDEARAWCKGHGVALDERGLPSRPFAGEHGFSVSFPASPARLVPFTRLIDRALQPRDSCLLWVTLTGVWRSSENLHLYYRLRQSYGDGRLLEEAPGHLFLSHEGADLLSYLEVGIVSGWDIYLLPTGGYAKAFVSHDEWVELSFDNRSEGVRFLEEARESEWSLRAT